MTQRTGKKSHAVCSISSRAVPAFNNSPLYTVALYSDLTSGELATTKQVATPTSSSSPATPLPGITVSTGIRLTPFASKSVRRRPLPSIFPKRCSTASTLALDS
ncbi:hypothetical protein CBOM_01740 [Ceraceosorus bombacis]|uniref:Uncharacterized protein n=1 Tax=Ceraceosorus bombacis TaxID=401625 RepID=A0A0P1BCM4_9BASI|nr:hypothetical protein CBOM_01740 [Ceraceosorus bombacis]